MTACEVQRVGESEKNILHVVNSAAVSPDEFAVFVYVSVQQKTVLNSPYYQQPTTDGMGI